MRKVAALVLFLSLISSFCPNLTRAQEATPTAQANENNAEIPAGLDFKQAYADYIQYYNAYLQAHKEYLIAKNQYETYKTLTAKTIALEQTMKMLQARDDVIITFLIALRAKLAEETNIGSSQLNLLYLWLDEEVIWFRGHKETLTSAGSIPDLIRISGRAQERYQRTEALIYQSLLEMFLYKEAAFQNQVQDQVDVLEKKIVEIRGRADKDTSVVERWLLEAKNRQARSAEKLEELSYYEIKSSQRSSEKSQNFNKSVYIIEQAHQYLKETNDALLEIVKEVKRGD